jgi:tubulin polyglutamylase TTLL9
MCSRSSILKKCTVITSLTGNEEQIGGFDLIYKGGPVKQPHNPAGISLIGAQNNRDI